MNKRVGKTVALIMSALLIGSAAGAGAYAIAGSQKNSADETVQNEVENLIETDTDADTVKDETVYVIAGADGSVKKIIVSDWIQNRLGTDKITDSAELDDPQNLKGDGTYTMDGDTMRVWDADGKDIYLRGESKNELPVELYVSYELDGSAISAEELAGKSGHVKIRFDYKNNRSETVSIDGRDERIYVPFAMLTGMLLDNDVFTNIDVTGGRLINDGDRTAVVGLAFPGLGDNLGIDSDSFKIPDSFEITADVHDFKMTNTVTIATNEIFNKVDPDAFDSADSLTDAVGELGDAMDQLLDGSSQLYSGLNTLLDKSGELVSGIDKLTVGAEALRAGAKSLDSGAAELDSGAAALASGSTELAVGADTLKSGTGALASGANDLSDGARKLAEGLSELKGNNDKLCGGAETVFESILGTADSELAAAGLTVPKLTIENFDTVLSEVIASLDEDKVAELARSKALETVTEKVEAKRSDVAAGVTEAVRTEVTAAVTKTVRTSVTEQVLAASGMTKEQYDAGVAAGVISAEQQAAINGAIDQQMNSDAVQSTIETNVALQMSSDSIKSTINEKTDETINSLIEQNMNSSEVQDQITAALETAKSGAAQISALKSQLDSYNEFYNGISEYTAGVASAADGAKALSEGADTLKSGAAAIDSGANELASGAGELADGAAALKGGTASLKSGTSELLAGMSELYDGILTMKNGAPALTDGVGKLADGAMKLSDGLSEFNERGVSRLTDAIDDVSTFITRARATVDVSRGYKSFSGLVDGTDGEVRFVYRTDSIGK